MVLYPHSATALWKAALNTRAQIIKTGRWRETKIKCSDMILAACVKPAQILTVMRCFWRRLLEGWLVWLACKNELTRLCSPGSVLSDPVIQCYCQWLHVETKPPTWWHNDWHNIFTFLSCIWSHLRYPYSFHIIEIVLPFLSIMFST